MDIKIIGSTKVGHKISKNDSLKFGATLAGVCYMQDSFDTILKEDLADNIKRQNITLNNRHHSVYGHTSLNLLLENVPKILAMVLNNEKVYVTSEKSARYTKMDQVSGLEKELYDKWMDIFQEKIVDTYPQIKKGKAKKLAQENARYMTSVFTPTTMAYTTNFRQLNYIMHKFDAFSSKKLNTDFDKNLRSYLTSFNIILKGMVDETKDYYVDELIPVDSSLSLFDDRKKQEFFDECYSVNYSGSFAELAQAQRHRTLNYSMSIPDEKRFFIPNLIQDDDIYASLWLEDISKVSDKFPQGMMIDINERGTYENFILKCYERLCGNAQLEIALETKNTLERYVDETRNDFVRSVLEEYNNGPRCTFEDYKCNAPCVFGKKGLERLI